MTGEIAIYGVFVPTLLILGIAASLVTMALMRLFNLVGVYRLFAYRALVDLCLFILVLGFFAWLSPIIGFHQ
ncbi:DUF1656 domain-containing protein [Hephaestia mangrovi]|uniref:DUF1656 domain-containing protein n=1 Tax=Hephaestia mangrovi TaxID=2873268 RepID=UPI001CA72D71|nr:DUF1656 domain-containing protein [Hephaestia mangrovi]MBY8827965.1 DUF1656 domain-containing protein [Hephaestia mangrovi]